MTTFYNIAKKQEVNPFADVTKVAFAFFFSSGGGCYKLKRHFDSLPDIKVTAEKVCDSWAPCYPLEVMDFVTQIKWFSPTQGLFLYHYDKIGFKIVGDTMILRCGQW